MTPDKSAASHNILNGPSKFDLMTALFVGDHEERLRITLELEVPSGPGDSGGYTKGEYVINGVSREDDSGENWIITGHRITELGWSVRPLLKRWIPVKGFYSSQRRKGVIEDLAE